MYPSTLFFSKRAETCPSALGKRLFQLIETKKTNLCVAADYTSADEVLKLAAEIGPDICILKLHADIIRDFSNTFIQELQKLAKEHNFLLCEDRKFCDIGIVSKEQYQGGPFRIADWADLVTVQSTPGIGIVEGLKEAGLTKQRGILLIAEMSSAGNLITPAYTESTFAMAEAHTDFVIGFIAQHALPANPHFIKASPGIQFNEGGDHLKQQYTSPQTAILKNGTDIIIVGRGITTASNRKQEAQKYREQAWNAYLERTGQHTTARSAAP